MATPLVENPGEVFIALIERGETSVQLPMAWAVMTAAIKGEIDISKTLRALDELKREAQNIVSSGEGERPDLRLQKLNSFFANSAGFRGNTETYNEPANSYMDDVLAQRTGIPITLALVFIELGNACGLKIDPVAFPGHFLVREATSGIVCDPFSNVVGLKQADCVRLLSQVTGREVEWDDQYLQPASKITIFQRMLNNLKNSFVSMGDMYRLEKVERLLEKIDLVEQSDASFSLH